MNVQLKRFGLFLFPCLLLADTFGPGFSGYSTVPVFVNNINSPGNPLVPVSYGGLTLNPSNTDQLIVGGNAARIYGL